MPQPLNQPKLKIEPEYADAFNAWKTQPSPTTASSLLSAIDPIIGAGLRSYAPEGSSSVRSRAKLLALDALPTYDPQRGPLKPHLMSQLQGLRRIAGRESSPIRIPERVAIDRMRLDEGMSELEDQLGREPSDVELSDHLGFPMKRLELIRKAQKPLAEGAFMNQNDDEGLSGLPAVRKLGQDPGETEWLEFVYSSLGPTDQLVMEQALGMHGRKPVPVQNIAKALRVSPGAVSQRMKRIQTLMDRRDELNPF